ncbi:MAG: LapA family protein [Gammaproteobacteria bacterium]|nr:LapA family protein [Gammaproteobacteria bacterium]
MLRNVLTILLLVLVALFAAVFAAQNPGVMTLDLGVIELVDARISVVFVATFALGWLFGLLCCVYALLRLIYQRRNLRRKLETAQSEISSLRSLPMHDAH